MADENNKNESSKPTVSVIMCIYNTADFLWAAIHSILVQTETSWELLLIDDGSDDGSERICDEAAQQDPRVHAYHKRNGGLSDSRNYGLARSKGEYVTFVDSDDLIDSQFLSILLDAMLKRHAWVGISSFNKVAFNYKLNDMDHPGEEQDEGTGEKYCCYNPTQLLREAYLSNTTGINFTTWGKIYKKEIFTKNNIAFPVGKIHEDIFTTYLLYYYCHQAVFVSKRLYYYRMRKNSIMHTNFSKKNLVALDGTREACEFFISKGEEELAELAGNFHLRLYFYDLYQGTKNNLFDRSEKKIFLSGLRHDVDYYTRTVEFPLLKKMAFRFAAVFPLELFVSKVML